MMLELIRTRGVSRALVGMVNLILKKKMRDSFEFPTRSYGLKSIGSFLGYSLKNSDLKGLKVAMEVQRHI